MAPGPTPVPPEVLAAGARPSSTTAARTSAPSCCARWDGCRRLQTPNDVLLFTASGSAAFESAVVNLLAGRTRPRGHGGRVGERWAALARAYDVDVHELRYGWGRRLAPRTFAPDSKRPARAPCSSFTRRPPPASSATSRRSRRSRTTQARSSSSTRCRASGRAARDRRVGTRRRRRRVSEGAHDPARPLRRHGLDCGLGALARRLAPAVLPRLGADARVARDRLDPFTPAVTIVAGLDVALGLLLEEGLEAAFARHAALGRACREGAKAMGLELFSPDEDRSAIVTAILTPNGVDARDLVLALRDRFGITVAGGHGSSARRCSGSGTSATTTCSISPSCSRPSSCFWSSGADVERGAAVARALEAYRETARVWSHAPSVLVREPIAAPDSSLCTAGSMSSRIVTLSSPRSSASSTRSWCARPLLSMRT